VMRGEWCAEDAEDATAVVDEDVDVAIVWT
jgi:hypothetical protein